MIQIAVIRRFDGGERSRCEEDGRRDPGADRSRLDSRLGHSCQAHRGAARTEAALRHVVANHLRHGRSGRRPRLPRPHQRRAAHRQGFREDHIQAGDRVSVTLSHEVLEMLGDTDINLMVQKGPRGYAYEVCDAVEDDSLGYDINGVRVSDFVYPQYFETFWHKGATKFDHLGHLSGPLPSLTHGGYMSYLDYASGQWKQITARLDEGNSTHRNDSPVLVKALYRERPHVGGRRYRRALPPSTWLVSTVASS